MKKFGILGLISVTVIALIAVPGAQAQRIGNPATPVNLVSLNVSNSFATNYVATVDVSDVNLVSAQLIVSNTAASTSNTVVTIDRSVDGVNWVTGWKTITIANAGTTTTSCISNFTALADRYWRLSLSSDVLSNTACTNFVSVKINKKPGL